MVRQGGFKVLLVHPETKQPYKEHEKDGKVFAEVEPHAEYMIQFQVENDPAPKTSGKTMVYVTFEVDGVNLGYYQTVKVGDDPQEAGYYEYRHGVETETALRFERPKIAADTNRARAGEQASLLGKVSVIFAEAEYRDTRRRSDVWTSDKPTSLVDAPFEEGANGKVVRSEPGTWSQSTNYVSADIEESHWEEGRIFNILTIHYCTATGLILQGVLRKPPLWEYAKLQAPHQKAIDPEIASISCQQMKIPPVVRDGKVVRKGSVHDYFDLTSLATDPDADSEHDDSEPMKFL
jgi:hypothetical protein